MTHDLVDLNSQACRVTAQLEGPGSRRAGVRVPLRGTMASANEIWVGAVAEFKVYADIATGTPLDVGQYDAI